MSNQNERERSGFTKLGFSKSGFAACGHFTNCFMGKQECYWFLNGRDVEVRDYCHCYLNNHPKHKNPNYKEPQEEVETSLLEVEEPVIEEKKSEKVKEKEEVKEMEQLSLF